MFGLPSFASKSTHAAEPSDREAYPRPRRANLLEHVPRCADQPLDLLSCVSNLAAPRVASRSPSGDENDRRGTGGPGVAVGGSAYGTPMDTRVGAHGGRGRRAPTPRRPLRTFLSHACGAAANYLAVLRVSKSAVGMPAAGVPSGDSPRIPGRGFSPPTRPALRTVSKSIPAPRPLGTAPRSSDAGGGSLFLLRTAPGGGGRRWGGAAPGRGAGGVGARAG